MGILEESRKEGKKKTTFVTCPVVINTVNVSVNIFLAKNMYKTYTFKEVYWTFLA